MTSFPQGDYIGNHITYEYIRHHCQWITTTANQMHKKTARCMLEPHNHSPVCARWLTCITSNLKKNGHKTIGGRSSAASSQHLRNEGHPGVSESRLVSHAPESEPQLSLGMSSSLDVVIGRYRSGKYISIESICNASFSHFHRHQRLFSTLIAARDSDDIWCSAQPSQGYGSMLGAMFPNNT